MNDGTTTATVAMHVDLAGRVRNLQLGPNDCLVPLMEAVVNGIHAIDERFELTAAERGLIRIDVLREGLPLSHGNSQGRARHRPIVGFVVTDNGTGFTDKNLLAFKTTDTTNKLKIGGKGIGRLTWLKAFADVSIAGVFETAEGRLARRFKFSTSNGVQAVETTSASSEQNLYTEIRLGGFQERYANACPRVPEVIARRIVEYCIEYFVLRTAPRVHLYDEDLVPPKEADDESMGGSDNRADPSDPQFINLATVFDDLVRKQASTEIVTIRDHTFKLRHFLLRAAQGTHHRIALCANHRKVGDGELIKDEVPNLPDKLPLQGSADKAVYAVYVSGPYLDANVNQERTAFGFAADTEMRFPGFLTRKELFDKIYESATKNLAPYTAPIQEEKKERIRAYVQKRPRFRHLLKHCEADIERIRYDLADDRLEIELYRVHMSHEIGLRERGEELLKAAHAEDADYEGYRRRLAAFLDEMNDAGKSALADYVIHRRSMLEVLDQKISMNEHQKYELEELIHRFIFPMKADSDEVSYEDQNLWVLDEKLAYHYYLASDKPLSKLKVGAVASTDRPDLVVFNRPIAVVSRSEPFDSIVVVEFKRPERDDYTDEDNPIEQVLRYVRQLRSGEAKDRRQRTINVLKDLPFYCYIVASLTPKLREQAEIANLIPTPDNLGYYGYNRSPGAYIEIISFPKLIADAKSRNAVLFEKLNLPPLR